MSYVISRDIYPSGPSTKPVRTDYLKSLRPGGAIELTNNPHSAYKFQSAKEAESFISTYRISPVYEVKALSYAL